MKKIIKGIVIAMVIAHYSPYLGAASSAPGDETMFPALDEFFDDFNKLAGQTDESVQQVMQKGQENLTKDTESLFKAVRAETRKIEQAAMRGMQVLMRETADVSKGLEEAYESLKKSQDSLKKSIATIGSNVELSKKTRQVTIDEFESEGHKKWGLKIMLPGYAEKNLMVTISKDGATKKTLEITAKKDMPQRVDDKKQSVHVSQSFSRQVMVAAGTERKQERITCNNGVLTIMRDLPAFIDETKYVMKFADEVLTIEFDRKTVPAVTSLKFSK